MLENYKQLFNEKNFLEAVTTKKICLFLGSGVGFNIGMPDWLGLAREIVKFCLNNEVISRSEKLNLLSMNNPLKIISICIQKVEFKGKQDEFNNLLKKIFYETPKNAYKNNKVYQCLSKLYKEKAVLILQTNYDVMLEKYQTKEQGVNRRFYIPYMDMEPIPKNKQLDSIIYLHGRYSGDENELIKSSYTDLVLSKYNYNRVYTLENTDEFKRQRDFINNLFKEFYVIFLGYSLSDEEIIHIIANKPETEDFKQISVIVDNCASKTLENEFNQDYLQIASNEKIKTYIYDTETTGIEKGFEIMLEELCSEILKQARNKPYMINYINPEDVDFGEN